MAATHGRSGRPWLRIRAQVLREEPSCWRCGRPSTTVDHIQPLSLRPDLAHDRSNLRGSCGPCNYSAGAKLGNKMRGKPKPKPAPKVETRLTFYSSLKTGEGCPVSNHGTLCGGGHLVPLKDWKPWYGTAPTWPDGEFCPDDPRAAS